MRHLPEAERVYGAPPDIRVMHVCMHAYQQDMVWTTNDKLTSEFSDNSTTLHSCPGAVAR